MMSLLAVGFKNLPLTSRNAQIYLKDRGLTKKDVIYWKIGYCDGGQYDGRILIPSFNKDGYCNYCGEKEEDCSEYKCWIK